ncbi:succinate-semialdehyde dehydrogenase [Nitzschia inconspicua]|uniref:Succinate-semialdehyde dehydrogenase n=1 Tax=Nitzschia inconspicua TaxID=303405 RepID=A0A9K3LP72_9STRA|nr:succinate-semialdehyde dehydrogenase [Nitzschia inconspicua]
MCYWSQALVLRSYNPATGELLGELIFASADDVSAAVQNARTAQKSTWSKLTLGERVDFVIQAYQSLIQNDENDIQERLSERLAMEMGKDFRRAQGEMRSALQSGPYLAKEAAQAFEPVPLRSGRQYFAPLGVVALITPWNYPVMMANNLLVPALIAGNTVILKPSEETPLIAQEFFGRISQALPQDVLQILHGDGSVGKQLVESPHVAMIAFTGSQATGRDIMSRAGPTMKRLVMELGGNDPMIVLKDANLDQAARFAVAGGFENAGQMCTSIERIYVDQSVAPEFEAKVAAFSKAYKVGPWNETNVNVGPIINSKQHAKIMDHIRDASEKGGRFIVGGLTDPDSNDKYRPPYIAPTIIADMSTEMKLEQEETFGPVIGISSFQTVDEAIERANDSDYGLGAVVFGHDGAQDVASRLEAGMVGINQGQGGGGGPWVGAKQSGFGYHGTKDGHRQFMQIKVDAVAYRAATPERCLSPRATLSATNSE